MPETFQVFEPIRIRYDGLDAAHHQMEILRLGESMTGTARMLGTLGNFALTGKFVRKTPALSVRVLTAPPEQACYEISAVIASVYSALPISPSSMTKLVEHMVQYILAKFGGKPKEAAQAMELAKIAVQEMGSTSRAQSDVVMKALEIVADSQRANARLIASPVGETCETVMIGRPDRFPMIIDRSVKDALNSPQPAEILDEKTYEVIISEIDRIRHTCKVSLVGDDDQRYDGEIADPVIDLPNNPYTEAVSSQTTLKIKAKVRVRDGDLDKFFILNTAA